MSKRRITRLWIAGLVVLVVGLVTGGVGLALMFAYGGHFTPAPSGNGSDFVPSLDDAFWTAVGVLATGLAIVIVGATTQVAAWVGALVNTHRLQDKTWFIVLLIGGILGLHIALLGLAAMVAYLVAGPDGTSTQESSAPTSDSWPATVASIG